MHCLFWRTASPVTCHHSALQQQAAADRLAAYCLRQEAQMECRQLLESTTSRADALLQQAQIDAERLKDRAWQAIRLAIKELEA